MGKDAANRNLARFNHFPWLKVTTKRNYNTSAIELEWDADKAARNLKKHGVSLEDAELVFLRRRAD
jgi:hypothetical protein